MRKKQKEQLNRIVTLVKKAVLEMEQKTQAGKEKLFSEMFEECKEALALVGRQIDLFEDPSFVHSLSLEEIKVVLQKIEKRFDEIPVKKQVVFLPYKASMWDSLESVWKEADADPNCDAYVIPIPYFDKDGDGDLGKMHYEGDLYPKNVPITSYRDFNLEEQRPDQIFIHNPYDEYNLITSVHPDFYSSKLKKYTEELIYIPYFILDEIDPVNTEAVEHMAHFCKVPGVLNAHKVIVQSPQMKQVYVNVLSEWMGEATRSTWEEKILGLGSPKVDKILSARKEDLEVPTEWLSIIQKSDGSWKKIVFYNTSLAAFLEHSNVYIDKVRNVLQMFKDNREDIAILWRPHPLMITTIESMRPDVKEAYINLVENYKKEGWGIYDDSLICL